MMVSKFITFCFKSEMEPLGYFIDVVGLLALILILAPLLCTLRICVVHNKCL